MTDEQHRDRSTRDEQTMDDPQLTASEQARLAAVVELLADQAMWGGPPVDLEDAVVATIRDEAGAVSSSAGAFHPPAPHPPAPAPPAPAPPGLPSTSLGSVARIDGAPSARRRSWITVVAAAVTSAAAAVLITTAVVHRDQHDGGSAVGAPSASAPATTSPSQDEAPTGRPDSAFPGTTATRVLPGVGAAVPTSIDQAGKTVQTVTLNGTALARDAIGTVDVSVEPSGTRLAIHVTGLVDRRDGDFYQVWLSDCAGTELIPAGSFHNLDSAVAWAGVSPDEFPRITVTAESAAPGRDVGQESSGEVYVDGTIGACPG